jgi:hypothetical protein
MAEVFVIDRVVTAPGCARPFVEAYLAGYAPGARARGMALRDVLVSPPIWWDDRSNVVTITWVLPSPLAWWQMTWQGRPDPTVGQWWKGIADLVVERTREVATAPDDVVLDAPPAEPGAVESSTAAKFGVTRLIDVAESERDRVVGALRRAAARSGASSFLVEPTSAGSRNGGDVLAHLRFEDQSGWEESGFDSALTDPSISRVNGATYRGDPIRAGSGTGTIYRALLLRVAPDVEPERVRAFERELAMMPRYVPSIVAWQLSRVETAVGSSAWTHVFEQVFTDVDGLMGPYLMHPVHWAVVDRWFDPETTDTIVQDRVCHSFCELPAALL